MNPCINQQDSKSNIQNIKSGRIDDDKFQKSLPNKFNEKKSLEEIQGIAKKSFDQFKNSKDLFSTPEVMKDMFDNEFLHKLKEEANIFQNSQKKEEMKQSK